MRSFTKYSQGRGFRIFSIFLEFSIFPISSHSPGSSNNSFLIKNEVVACPKDIFEKIKIVKSIFKYFKYLSDVIRSLCYRLQHRILQVLIREDRFWCFRPRRPTLPPPTPRPEHRSNGCNRSRRPTRRVLCAPCASGLAPKSSTRTCRHRSRKRISSRAVGFAIAAAR